MHEDPESDEEEFVYPSARAPTPPNNTLEAHENHEDNVAAEQAEPLTTTSETAEAEVTSSPIVEAAPPQPTPTPAQLEASFAASSSGDLNQLKSVFRNARETSFVEPFALANDASSRTGLTTLHVAASRGYLNIVTWCQYLSYDIKVSVNSHNAVVTECGAMPDLEDREGEASRFNNFTVELGSIVFMTDCAS